MIKAVYAANFLLISFVIFDIFSVIGSVASVVIWNIISERRID